MSTPTARDKMAKMKKRGSFAKKREEQSDNSSDSEVESDDENKKMDIQTTSNRNNKNKNVQKKGKPPVPSSSSDGGSSDDNNSSDEENDDRVPASKESKSAGLSSQKAASNKFKKGNNKKKNVTGSSKSDSSDDENEMDSDTGGDTGTDTEDENETGKGKKLLQGSKKKKEIDRTTGVSTSRGNDQNCFGCVDKCGQFAVGLAASFVTGCGGGLRKEPPSWLENDHDGSAKRPDLHFSSKVCLCVQVYGTDPLVQDPYVSSPVVMVHCVDAITGEYLMKENVDKPSTSYNEQQTNITRKGRDISRASDSCQRVTPLLTPPCLLGSRGMYGERLHWSDEDGRLLWGEKYDTFVRQGAVFLFEVLDIVPKGPDSLDAGNGWYRIAWGFLRPIGPDLQPNISVDMTPPKRSRIQLYYHTDGTAIMRSIARKKQAGSIHGSPVPSVYYSFLSKKLRPYPSTLYLSITGVKPPTEHTVLDRRPMNVFEKESHSISYEDAMREAEIGQSHGKDGKDMDTGELNDQAKRVVRRTRAEGEPCLVPDTVVSRIPVGKSGCNAIQFSNDGRFIAAACQNGQSQHVVRVFEVENGKATSWGAELTGHHAVIYSLAWSREDDMLASASSDGSVIVWPVPKRINDDDDDDTKMNSPRESEKRTLGVRRRTILTHLPPSYVYCVGFHPTADPPILCTGAYDAQIRLWDVADRGETTKGKDRHSESASALASRLSGNVDSTTLSTREIGSLGRGVALHSSRINVLVFDRRGIRLFTGDGAGVVNVWRCNGDPAETASYRVIKRIEHPDVNGHPISSISVSDVTNTLLVHAKQSIIRMIELKYYRSPHPGFTGAHCGSDIVQSCFSADGRYVLSGSRTGGAHVWKSATGVAVFPAPIRGHRFGQTLSCVAWHPNQHLCALTSRGDGCPILLMEADRDKVNPDEALEASEIMKKRLETMEMDPDELALMDESELTTEQLKVLKETRSLRRSELAMSYAEGVADKFGGDVAHAMRSSAGILPPSVPNLGEGLRNERKSGDSSISRRGLPPVSRPADRSSGSRPADRSSGSRRAARSVEDILNEAKERRAMRNSRN